jgi:hypothetical protein
MLAESCGGEIEEDKVHRSDLCFVNTLFAVQTANVERLIGREIRFEIIGDAMVVEVLMVLVVLMTVMVGGQRLWSLR